MTEVQDIHHGGLTPSALGKFVTVKYHQGERVAGTLVSYEYRHNSTRTEGRLPILAFDMLIGDERVHFECDPSYSGSSRGLVTFKIDS
ncbi:hypothetical protein [Kocuria oceani]|uniref:hypothetical protein n=1 Tax=Kocuria oceani TaxID=988827 RepID=UPI0024067C72|nr:hypothetical protein [Kocuria oceani]